MQLFEEEKLKFRHLEWREEPDALHSMWNPMAVYMNGKIFLGDRWDYSPFLYEFNVTSRVWLKRRFYDSREMWGFTMATTNNQLHILGGEWKIDKKVEKCSNEVFSLNDGLKWSTTLPPLNIGRFWATSASFDGFISVAGGQDRNYRWLSSVELLNSSQSSSTWWEICDLPVKSYVMQCTVTHNEIFIGCGRETERTIYTAKLSALKECKSNSSPEPFWHPLPKTPLVLSGLISLNSLLLTVGGQAGNGLKYFSSVYLYDRYKNTWTLVCEIGKSRYCPAVVVCLAENKLFVLCGGVDADTSVESCKLL